MIEVTLLNYLNTNTRGIKCYLQQPVKNVPEKYILVERTAGSVDNFIKRATFAIQSYAPSMYEAASLNDYAKQLMDNFITVPSVSKSKLNSDYNYTDKTKKNYRYQAVYNVWFTE